MFPETSLPWVMTVVKMTHCGGDDGDGDGDGDRDGAGDELTGMMIMFVILTLMFLNLRQTC